MEQEDKSQESEHPVQSWGHFVLLPITINCPVIRLISKAFGSRRQVHKTIERKTNPYTVEVTEYLIRELRVSTFIRHFPWLDVNSTLSTVFIKTEGLSFVNQPLKSCNHTLSLSQELYLQTWSTHTINRWDSIAKAESLSMSRNDVSWLTSLTRSLWVRCLTSVFLCWHTWWMTRGWCCRLHFPMVCSFTAQYGNVQKLISANRLGNHGLLIRLLLFLVNNSFTWDNPRGFLIETDTRLWQTDPHLQFLSTCNFTDYHHCNCIQIILKDCNDM